MSTARLLCILGEVEDTWIDETPIQEAKVPIYRPVYSIAAAVAACAAFVLVVGVMFWHNGSDSTLPIVTPQQTTATPTTQTTEVTSATKYIPYSPLGCYAFGPKAGEYFLDIYAREYLLEKIRDDPQAKVFVSLHMYLEDKPVLSGDAKYREIKRLVSCGYEIYIQESDYNDYWGAPKHLTSVYAMLNLEQLENFDAGDTYGYMLNTVYDQVTPEDCVKMNPATDRE